jgi:GT2 family glycosyltransferase
VLVIDNAGRLDEAEAKDAAPLAVEIHRPERNLGFSDGCTFGISLAMERGADLVLLLNNDVVVDPLFLDPLLNAMNAGSDVGLLSPQVVLMGSPDKAWYRGGKFSLWSGIPIQGQGRRMVDRSCPPREVDYATGCAMLLRTALIRRVGSFDPRFFVYCEDVDLSMRVRQAGFRILFVPASVVYHEVTCAPDRLSLAIYYSTRNLIEVMRKHAPWYTWVSFSANFLVRWLGFFTALALVRGQPRYLTALIRGLADFARGKLGENSQVHDARAGRATRAPRQ